MREKVIYCTSTLLLLCQKSSNFYSNFSLVKLFAELITCKLCFSKGRYKQVSNMHDIAINSDDEKKNFFINMSNVAELNRMPKGNVRVLATLGEVVCPSTLYGGFITSELSI